MCLPKVIFVKENENIWNVQNPQVLLNNLDIQYTQDNQNTHLDVDEDGDLYEEDEDEGENEYDDGYSQYEIDTDYEIYE